MVGMLLFPVLAALFVFIWMTRPGPSRLFRGRYRRRRARVRLVHRNTPDATVGLRDPARPF